MGTNPSKNLLTEIVLIRHNQKTGDWEDLARKIWNNYVIPPAFHMNRRSCMLFLKTVYVFIYETAISPSPPKSPLKKFLFDICKTHDLWSIEQHIYYPHLYRWFTYFDENADGTFSWDEFKKTFDLVVGEITTKQITTVIKKNLVCSTNLIDHSINYVQDMTKFYDEFQNVDVQAVSKILERYKIWIVSRSQAAKPLPCPKDVEMMLLVHMLHPLDYAKTCKKFFGSLMDKKKLVDRKYQGNWIPYGVTNLDELITFDVDLISSFQSQLKFFNKLLEHGGRNLDMLKDSEFLNRALVDYRKFLHLNKKNLEDSLSLKSQLVPTLHIDLMWHSHMAHPIAYERDCLQLVGIVLDHKDTGANFDQNFSSTSTKWEEHYNEPYGSESISAYTEMDTTYGGGVKFRFCLITDPASCVVFVSDREKEKENTEN